MNADELAALCQRVDAARPPPEIRLCCPRGHFIIAVILAARLGPPPSTNELIMGSTDGRHQHFVAGATAGRETIVETDGFRLTPTPHGRVVTLSCRRCSRWTLTRDYQRLAVELAVYALAGKREYRL